MRDGTFNGDSCQFSHAGFVRNSSETSATSKSTPKLSTCRHGDSCSRLAKGTCSFYHWGVGVQKPRQQNKQSQKHPKNDHPNPLRCPRGPSCVHLTRGAHLSRVWFITTCCSRRRSRRRSSCAGRTGTTKNPVLKASRFTSRSSQLYKTEV